MASGWTASIDNFQGFMIDMNYLDPGSKMQGDSLATSLREVKKSHHEWPSIAIEEPCGLYLFIPLRLDVAQSLTMGRISVRRSLMQESIAPETGSQVEQTVNWSKTTVQEQLCARWSDLSVRRLLRTGFRLK
jgi:hypothetical protein